MGESMRSLGVALTAAVLAGGVLVGGSTSVAAQAPVAASPGSSYTPLAPVRVLDTRNGTGGHSGAVGQGATITIDLSSRLAPTATAVVLNVTGTEPTGPTFVTVFPHGEAQPEVSNLNLVAGQTRPNLVTVRVGADRKVGFFNNAGSVHLIADLAGYYSTAAGARYTPLDPSRLLDTRSSEIPPVGQGGTISVNLTDRVPASATAVAFNLTATGPTAATFVTAWPNGAPRPHASNVNVLAGETAPNMVIVPIGTGRKVNLFNNAGSVDLIADLSGFYTPDYGALYVPVTPTRVLDTRDGRGTFNAAPIGPGKTIAYRVQDEFIPAEAIATVMNLTGTAPTADTYVTAWEARSPYPFGSSLNLTVGQTAANMVIPTIQRNGTAPNYPGISRGTYVYNNAGTVHAIADVAGYFVLPAGDCQTGCVYAWSYGSWPQPGPESVSFPRLMSGLSNVVAIAGSARAGLALRSDGTVRAWDNNDSLTLGNGWGQGESLAPVPVLGLTSVTSIALGWQTAYALRSDGTVRAWGMGSSGQLPGHISYAPVAIPGLTAVSAIAAGAETGYALRSDGTVWAWGSNTKGELGNGSTAEKSATPVQVSGLTGVVKIASGGNNAYAVKSDGTLWAWGDNTWGQLGDGAACDDCPARTPKQVAGLSGITAVAAGPFVLRNDGAVFGWGYNGSGALGNGLDCPPATSGPNCISKTPMPVSGLTDAKAIAPGYAVRTDGTAWAWGNNEEHGLGHPNLPYPHYRTVPVQVYGLTGVTAVGGALALVS